MGRSRACYAPLCGGVPRGASHSALARQTDCFEDFWQGFVNAASCNLHIDVIRGRSDHHKIEGCFKAVSRAIRAAVEIDPRRNGAVPSTKGVIV